MDNKQYVFETATILNRANSTLPANELANIMNHFNRTTTYGTPYAGLRGTYTLIHATYDWLVAQGNQQGADVVATAFTKPDGIYAYQ